MYDPRKHDRAAYDAGYRDGYRDGRIHGTVGTVGVTVDESYSCIAAWTRLRTPQGWVTADMLASRWEAGYRVSVCLDSHWADGSTVGYVLGATRTMARGYTVRLDDGRSVTLTGGHVLPGAGGERRWLALPPPVQRRMEAAAAAASGRLLTGSIAHNGHLSMVDADHAGRFAPVQAGDMIDGACVLSVEPQGLIPAVRIHADAHGWLLADGGAGVVRVGQRWHEHLQVLARLDQDGRVIDTWGQDWMSWTQVQEIGAPITLRSVRMDGCVDAFVAAGRRVARGVALPGDSTAEARQEAVWRRVAWGRMLSTPQPQWGRAPEDWAAQATVERERRDAIAAAAELSTLSALRTREAAGVFRLDEDDADDHAVTTLRAHGGTS